MSSHRPFILFVNEPELIHFSYMRFLENRLRESFGFEGTPIRLVLRGKKRDDETNGYYDYRLCCISVFYWFNS